ncbi:protein of unknown function [Desulfofundulus australicus DSM 11792]|uniref:DUF927 domain-containing protein n=1 Tax=Desulfofundulus australicus DSM 11792 TaxID=1121425 RepID=A0A1M5DPB8_9FIRM|nr:toprim domain-containing protein [Desulfofundulus australicus]SHF68746.1 protein of unknown function [Desulfofundulus australicus DSM 11792]
MSSIPCSTEEIKTWLESVLPHQIMWRGDEGQTRCPLDTHGGPDVNPSFTVNAAKGTFYCHKEKLGGGLRELARRLGVDLPFGSSREKAAKRRIVATYDYRDVDGNLVYQVVRYEPKDFRQRRPDPANPGKWVWNMKGVSPLPYRLPELLAALERGETVFIVEGEKDADNLAALGLAATCNHGGAKKWDEHHSRYFPAGAEVVVLPDNDDSGFDHAQRITNQLTERGCRVKVVELPGLPPKGDVSDWLAAGHTRDELLNLVEQAEYWQPEPQEQNIYSEWQEVLAGTRYRINGGYLCYQKFLQNGDIELVPIANFLARPRREIIRDNGLEREMTFELEGILAGGQPLPRVIVPAEKFASLSWVPAAWGMAANVEPGSTNKDRVRHAIQCMARGVKRETVYTHLGWRKIDGRWVFLHAGGAVGADDVLVDVETEGGGLSRYVLPEEVGDPAEAMSWSLKTLEVAPENVTVPLFALVYLAPLCEPLRQAGIEPSFVEWLLGQTGVMKSTLAGLFLCHFGRFTGKELPSCFRDTANAIEKKAFVAKDALLIIDDYHPTGKKDDARKMLAIAEQFLRSYGDRYGRTRMKADTTLRAAYVPRGLCLATGEDVPGAAQSTAARYFAVELKKGDVKVGLLTELQDNKEQLARAMRGYLEYVAPNMDKLPGELKEAFHVLREKARKDGQHARIPEVVAWLHIGLNAGLEYAVHAGAISQDERKRWLTTGWRVLLELAEKQARRIEEEKPAVKFINALSEMLAAGEVKTELLVSWREDEPEAKALPDNFIGWEDRDWFYLLPETVYRRVVRFYRDQDVNFPVTARTLWKHLEAEGLIFVAREGNRTQRTVRETIAGKRQRVLKLKADAVKKNDSLI